MSLITHVREAVGVFEHANEFEAAIDDLMSHGFDRSYISLMAGVDTVEEKLGHAVEKVTELEDNPNVPRKAYIGRESLGDAKGAVYGSLMFLGAVTAAGGVIASGGAVIGGYIAAMMGGAAGSLVGSVFANIMDENFAKSLQEQLDKGGLLMWVKTVDEEDEAKAMDILNRHGAKDVHVHTIPA